MAVLRGCSANLAADKRFGGQECGIDKPFYIAPSWANQQRGQAF